MLYLTGQGTACCLVFRQALLCSHSVRCLHTAVQLKPLRVTPHTAPRLRLYSPNMRRPNLFDNILSGHSQFDRECSRILHPGRNTIHFGSYESDTSSLRSDKNKWLNTGEKNDIAMKVFYKLQTNI